MIYQLLQKNNSVTVHTRNIHLSIEMYTVRNNISPNFIREIFPTLGSAYNLRQSKDFITVRVNTVFCGDETLRNIGPKIWDLLPLNRWMAPTLDTFISKVKKWQPDKCHCRLCKCYIKGIGFL